jgi:hypothetical protein
MRDQSIADGAKCEAAGDVAELIEAFAQGMRVHYGRRFEPS